jgi:hypothetical protein
MDARAIRKKELIARGALHRAELLVARQALRESAQPQALGLSLLRHLTGRLSGAAADAASFDPSRLDLATLLPLAANGLSLLRGRSGLIRLLWRSGALTALAVAGTAFLRRRQGAKPAPGEDL